jgi:hypothetical protein
VIVYTRNKIETNTPCPPGDGRGLSTFLSRGIKEVDKVSFEYDKTPFWERDIAILDTE